MVDDGQRCPQVCGGANALKECGLMLDRRLGGQERGLSYLLTHLLLFGRMGLHVLAERAGVRVALGAAGDLTGVWLL